MPVKKNNLVHHNDGTCVAASQADLMEGVTNVRTLCGHYIVLPGGFSSGEPSCAECLALMVKEEPPSPEPVPPPVHIMTARELTDSGLLQEANRQFFHPRGFALGISLDNERDWATKNFKAFVLDARKDPAGMSYDAGVISAEKAASVAAMPTRPVQPVPPPPGELEALKAERDRYKAGCEAMAAWWNAHGIEGTKELDEVATICRRALQPKA